MPSLVTDVADQWQLDVLRLLPGGANSVVFSCLSSDGEPLVLKLTPDLRIAADEATALDAWASSPHVVSLVDANLSEGALLLESIHPGTKLSESAQRWSLDEVAPMLADLAAPRPARARRELPGLGERLDFLFDLTAKRSRRLVAGNYRVPSELVRQSHELARTLLVDAPDSLVHGDLHPGNVLRAAGDRGVVAIDPRPCSGDPAFDAVDWVIGNATDEDTVERRIDWLAQNLDHLDAARVRAWCRATAVVVAVSALAHSPATPTTKFLLGFAARTD